MQVTETKFKLAEAVKEIIGLCMQPRGGLGDKRMDVTVTRSRSLHLSNALCKLALLSSNDFLLKAKTQVFMECGGGGVAAGALRHIFRFVTRRQEG